VGDSLAEINQLAPNAQHRIVMQVGERRPKEISLGWQIWLNCWPSQDFLVIGIQLKNLAGRLHSEVEELVLFIIKLTLKINQ